MHISSKKSTFAHAKRQTQRSLLIGMPLHIDLQAQGKCRRGRRSNRYNGSYEIRRHLGRSIDESGAEAEAQGGDERTGLPPGGECLVKKSKGLNGSRRAQEQSLAQVIRSLRPKHALKHLLRAAGMARSTYYYRLSERPDKYASIKEEIHRIYSENKGRYGCRRVWQSLRIAGWVINRKTVARLMHMMSLFGITPKRHYRSYQGDVGKKAPNVLDREFAAPGPFRKLTTDISQFVINGVKWYLSPILDMWNGEIISYTVSRSPNMALVMKMLKKAFRRMGAASIGALLHSDQGWQYQHAQYQLALKEHGMIQSMSRKGNCLDNSVMENFFGLLKNEFYYVNHFADEQTFLKGLADYIKYYNNDRIKLRLSMSPFQYRQQHTINN